LQALSLPAAASARYDITVEFAVLPGSALLQACFYGIAAAIVFTAGVLLKRAALNCGDSPRQASALQGRYSIGASLWLFAVSAASYSGALLPRGGPPLPFVALVVSIFVIAVLISRSAAGDRFARGLPLAVLVGFQGFRLPLELAMHRAHDEGLMPIQMSYSGQNFDIVTGITALVLAAALTLTRVPRWVVAAWNILGFALLANIVGVAILSTPVFAFFGRDRLNVWVMWMPYTLLPAVMVLAALAGHLIVWRALSLRAASTPDLR
jgi:hypothetical protein